MQNDAGVAQEIKGPTKHSATLPTTAFTQQKFQEMAQFYFCNRTCWVLRSNSRPVAMAT
jgi:hypothetical protein